MTTEEIITAYRITFFPLLFFELVIFYINKHYQGSLKKHNNKLCFVYIENSLIIYIIIITYILTIM